MSLVRIKKINNVGNIGHKTFMSSSVKMHDLALLNHKHVKMENLSFKVKYTGGFINELGTWVCVCVASYFNKTP